MNNRNRLCGNLSDCGLVAPYRSITGTLATRPGDVSYGIIDNSAAQDKCFEDIFSRFSRFHASHKSLNQISDAHMIVKESEWTELLMMILLYGNSYILSSFNYRLEMKDSSNNGP